MPAADLVKEESKRFISKDGNIQDGKSSLNCSLVNPDKEKRAPDTSSIFVGEFVR